MYFSVYYSTFYENKKLLGYTLSHIVITLLLKELKEAEVWVHTRQKKKFKLLREVLGTAIPKLNEEEIITLSNTC